MSDREASETPKVHSARRFTVDELRALLARPSQAIAALNYDKFSSFLVEDGEMLEIAAHARVGALMPNFFLSMAFFIHAKSGNAANHDLFQKLWHHECDAELFQRLRALCLAHREELIELLSSRRVQTNSLHRSAVLFPAFCLAGRAFAGRSCTLFDLGTAAGLNLLLDLYSYNYPELDGRVWSSRFKSSVDLEIAFSWRGRKPDDVQNFFQAPAITKRIGIDLSPIDLGLLQDRQWYACFTAYLPEVVLGFLLLRQKVDFRLIQGDVMNALVTAAREVPADEVLLIMHSFLTGQLTAEARDALSATFDALGATRDLAVIAIADEAYSQRPVELRLRLYRDGQREDFLLARCEHSLDVGEWLEWIGPFDLPSNEINRT